MKTILITGATSGIGKATAERFAKEGNRLIICGRRAEVLNKIKEELSQLTEVYSLTFDVRNQQEVQAAIESLPESFKKIDVLVNNAGNAHGLEPLDEGSIADWDAMMDGNVKGLLYVSQPVIKLMKANGGGHIVNISSVAHAKLMRAVWFIALPKEPWMSFLKGCAWNSRGLALRLRTFSRVLWKPISQWFVLKVTKSEVKAYMLVMRHLKPKILRMPLPTV